jgi:hypothetical protein
MLFPHPLSLFILLQHQTTQDDLEFPEREKKKADGSIQPFRIMRLQKLKICTAVLHLYGTDTPLASTKQLLLGQRPLMEQNSTTGAVVSAQRCCSLD